VCQVTNAGISGCDHPVTSSSAFGGDRNPHNLVYVFDASYCAANGLLGVALADGSLRLINGRGICLTLLHLPGVKSHLTSFCWDSTGQRLATSVATGDMITWGIQVGDGDDGFDSQATVEVDAIHTGGHEPGRPLFGACYCGSEESQDLLVSWGVDGRLCLWDSRVKGEIKEPLAVLLDKGFDYPIYCVNMQRKMIAVAGGGNEGGFLGIPVFLYDYEKTAVDEQTSKKAKKVEAVSS
jgi:hypothetical protein